MCLGGGVLPHLVDARVHGAQLLHYVDGLQLGLDGGQALAVRDDGLDEREHAGNDKPVDDAQEDQKQLSPHQRDELRA